MACLLQAWVSPPETVPFKFRKACRDAPLQVFSLSLFFFFFKEKPVCLWLAPKILTAAAWAGISPPPCPRCARTSPVHGPYMVVVDDERALGGFSFRMPDPRGCLPRWQLFRGGSRQGPAHETKPPPPGDRGESGRRGGGGGQSEMRGERGRGEPFWLAKFTGSLGLVVMLWGADRAPASLWNGRLGTSEGSSVDDASLKVCV